MAGVAISKQQVELNRGKMIKAGLKLLVWVSVAAVALRFIIRDAVGYFSIEQASYGPFWPRWGWLLTHVIGGMLTILLGLFQLWSGLGQKYLRFHRLTGRLYLIGVLLGAGAAFYLSCHSVVGWTFGVSLFTLAAIWVITSAMAYVAIRHGQVQAHKEWMTRSYVLTFAFATFRLWIDLPQLSGLGTRLERYTTIAWLSWTVPLFVTEAILQLQRVIRPAELR